MAHEQSFNARFAIHCTRHLQLWRLPPLTYARLKGDNANRDSVIGFLIDACRKSCRVADGSSVVVNPAKLLRQVGKMKWNCCRYALRLDGSVKSIEDLRLYFGLRFFIECGQALLPNLGRRPYENMARSTSTRQLLSVRRKSQACNFRLVSCEGKELSIN